MGVNLNAEIAKKTQRSQKNYLKTQRSLRLLCVLCVKKKLG